MTEHLARWPDQAPARRAPPSSRRCRWHPPAATGLGEVVRRRYLLGMLVRNTIKSRYQGTVLGWLWSYLQPAIRFCMFYFLFQVMIGRGGGMENFAIHLFAGMVIVHFFTETFNGGTQSLVQNRSLITKLPVPREMFPVARMLVAAWHTVPMLVILVIPCVVLGWTPRPGRDGGRRCSASRSPPRSGWRWGCSSASATSSCATSARSPRRSRSSSPSACR